MNYEDIKLINCNRSASIEGRTNNDTNPAIFTNTLQETIKLNVGDAVSLERAFVNEIGAGNQQTIELKGENRTVRQADRERKSVHTTPVYTNVVFGDYYYEKSNAYSPNYRLGYYRSIRTNLIKSDVEIRDNLSSLIVGYYINANEYPQYIQQPRRWLQRYDEHWIPEAGDGIQSSQKVYSERDGTASGFNNFTINEWCFAVEDWIKRVGSLHKQKVDNTRYTVFVKDTVTYSTEVDGGADQFPADVKGVFSECTYYRMREKIDIEVDKGFNTPTSIAEQVTQQLQKVTENQSFNILDETDYVRQVTQTIETPTYKPINAQNYFYCKKANYDSYIAGHQDQAAYNWIASLGYIAVKRPEIFELGREMHNKIRPAAVKNRADPLLEWLPSLGANIWGGFQVLLTMENPDPTKNHFPSGGGDQGNPLAINVVYNEANLKIIRDYLDTQGYYEGLWTDIEDSPAYTWDASYVSKPSPTNSRFFHINPYADVPAAAPNNSEFGSDGYILEAGAQNVCKATIPIFFKYDDSQRDTYIAPENFHIDDVTFAYGFAQPYRWIVDVNDHTKDIYYIQLRPDLLYGIPKQLFTEAGDLIGFGRRIGHDFHATAFSTAIITPYSGNANCDIGVLTQYQKDALPALKTQAEFTNTSNWLSNIGDNEAVDLSPYMTQTYIGANTPTLSFDPVSSRFNISKLHNANNVGNDARAGSGMQYINNRSMFPPDAMNERGIVPPLMNPDQGDTIYKINPRPTQFGYSPTFKPYNWLNQAYRRGVYPETAAAIHAQNPQLGSNTEIYKGNNENIENYKIFDAHGGIYIESFGANKEEWEGSLWEILGYTYEQLNAEPSNDNVLVKRVNNTNLEKLYLPTTNCEVLATDSKAYVTNEFGANMYATSLPYPKNILAYDIIASGESYTFQAAVNYGTPLGYTPEVIIKTASEQIEAIGLPKAVLKPYYTIRSSLLEGFSAIGGDPTGANLPIMGIVDKYSAQNDYFLGNPSDLIFTCTKEKAIADITTSIHDPDGTFANVDNTSAVIYKIIRNIPHPSNIIGEILEDSKKNDKK